MTVKLVGYSIFDNKEKTKKYVEAHVITDQKMSGVNASGFKVMKCRFGYDPSIKLEVNKEYNALIELSEFNGQNEWYVKGLTN